MLAGEVPMGHVVAKQAYLRLQNKLDQMPPGARASSALFEILKELYSEEEADLAARLPFRPTTLSALAKRLGEPADQLRLRLDGMADKGLVFDFKYGDSFRYMLAPTVVGFFEFSMMRVRPELDQRRLARLYHQYIVEEGLLHASLLGKDKTSLFRTLVHEETLPADYREVMDWERASSVVAEAGRWAVGLCHCRHVASHMDEPCQRLPMDVCLTIGPAADYPVRHEMARDLSRDQALAILEQGREAGVVFLCDNVQRRPMFVCLCCGCCCEVLKGFKRFAAHGDTMSSNFLASVEASRCRGCGACARACPIDGIELLDRPRQVGRRHVRPLAAVDGQICLGCGVCALACKKQALTMESRPRRKLTPENSLARVLTMVIEQDKLHHFLIDQEAGLTSQLAGSLLGAVLQLPPAKQVLAQQVFRSRLVDYWLQRQRKRR
jgi:formate hydrogenlyase subunit 6/NADH:ubiquinone oxidoreductase subunit I